MYDVLVVGAGPSGCRIAQLVAKKGYDVGLIEKRDDIGEPVQCAGLVSHRIRTVITDLPDNVILNDIRRARFISKSTEFTLSSKRPFHVIDRAKLDKFLFLKARKEGVETFKSTAFEDYSFRRDNDDNIFLKVSVLGDEFRTKILVGADGPISNVASKSKLIRPSNIITGLQTTVEGKFDPDEVNLVFDSDISSDFFGWMIPINSRKARIGLAAKKNAIEGLEKMVKRYVGDREIEIKPDVAGRINFGVMKNTSSDRVMLVGDAACQVKPFSGGGIIYGLIGAGYCANACIKSLDRKIFNEKFLRDNYDKKWKSHLKPPIMRGLIMRRLMSGSNRRMDLMMRAAKNFKFLLNTLDVDFL